MATGNNKYKKQVVLPDDLYDEVTAFAEREDHSIGNAIVRILRLGIEHGLHRDAGQVGNTQRED